MKNIIAATLSTLVLALASTAASAEASPQLGGTCWGSVRNSLGSNTQFACQHVSGGTVTIQQIYEKGFRVVAMAQVESGFISLIIEQRN